jgi:hypothetical protein
VKAARWTWSIPSASIRCPAKWDAANGTSTDNTLALNIKVGEPLSAAQRERIESWLRTRFNIQKVLLTVERS